MNRKGILLTDLTEFVQGVYSLRQSTRFRSRCEISEKRAGEDWGLGIKRENSFLLLPPLPTFVLCIPRQLVAISSLSNVRPLFANHRWQLSTLRKSLALAGTGFGALRFNSKNIKRKNCYLPCYIMFSVNYHLLQSLAI